MSFAEALANAFAVVPKCGEALLSTSITHAALSTAAGLAFRLAIAGLAAFAVAVLTNT